MHLKSLTVRGFKSFASATTFEFEPGVTAVVGPNGSGKSNVVDALAWVMGEQGAKTLRGGKMEDVIFAGTAGRAPLGRAQVSLTIDNTDGALPIDYSEVTITRTLFRAGGSEYAINSQPCRLLDIQELLSDSGLGREMHVIVGQGQLDRILHATAEERRGFIEEAAGILKHRRRREKTVRKLDAMQANLTRLTDLTAELRRQLTPLGKQADVARRAHQVQYDARDARSRLLADDLVLLRDVLERETAAEIALQDRKARQEASLRTISDRQAHLEQLAAEATGAVGRARENWYQLSAIRERLRSLGNLAQERMRLLGSADVENHSGRDPLELDRQAEAVRHEERAMQEEAHQRAALLEEVIVRRANHEQLAAAEDQRLAGLVRAAADRREGMARLAGAVGAARSKVESTEAELGRLHESIAAAEHRRDAAEREFSEEQRQAAGTEEGEAGLDAEFEEADATCRQLEEQIASLRENERAVHGERDSLTARLQAQREGLTVRDGSRALLDGGLAGVHAPLAELLRIEPGYEAAVAAVLGVLADAVVVSDLAAAAGALRALKADDAGQASLLIAGSDTAGEYRRVRVPAAEAGGIPDTLVLAEVVSCPPPLTDAVARLLADVVLVPDLEAARGLLQEHPRLRAVTPDGDVITAVQARGGSQAAPSQLQLRAAIEATERRLEELGLRSETIGASIEKDSLTVEQARIRAAAALERLHESDARLAAAAEKLGHLGAALRSATGERERFSQLVQAAEENLQRDQETLRETSARLETARDAPEEAEPSSADRDRLAADATQARHAEMEARLALRTVEEQLRALANRGAALERAAAAERTARELAVERARVRQLRAAKAAAVARAVEQTLRFVDVSIHQAHHARQDAELVRQEWDEELTTLRTTAESLRAELAGLTDAVHRDELARAQQQLRIETLENRAIEELGLTPDHLVNEYGPHLPVPDADAGEDKWAALRAPVDADGRSVPAGPPYVRAEQEKRLKKAERDLASLGKVNPLALEEFDALEERHRFLSTQLEDLRATRKDLQEIIRQVDNHVEEVFAAAYQDTATQFERVFGRLFPGGEGRLVLTEPQNLLESGIEIEARPAGKKIKRLSLLSGGERSLTAVALLVAIFKARPSPFYVMDEVEAALDDTNLGRLITIFEELRESSQLIIITHQKRTMEVADALYGVTMRGDGVSTVISQRLV